MTVTESNRTHGVTAYKAGCRCDVCREAKSEAGRKYRQDNAEAVKARKREYYWANRDHILAKAGEWHRSNPGATVARNRKRKEVDPVRFAESQARAQQRHKAKYPNYERERAARRDPLVAALRRKRWKANHPERVKASRARRRGAEAFKILFGEWERLCARYQHCCFYCGERTTLTVDHIIPLARGGRHSIGNLIPACGSCNSSKNDRLLVEWRAIRKTF